MDIIAIKIPDRASVAEAVGTSDQYLYQVESKRRAASPELALKIERATGGKVTRHELRPDIYGPAPGVDPPIPAASSETRAA